MRIRDVLAIMFLQAVIIFAFMQFHGYHAMLKERRELEETRLKYTQEVYKLIVNRSFNQIVK